MKYLNWKVAMHTKNKIKQTSVLDSKFSNIFFICEISLLRISIPFWMTLTVELTYFESYAENKEKKIWWKTRYLNKYNYKEWKEK